jgi:hypothetical protein
MLRNFEVFCSSTIRRMACSLALSCMAVTAHAVPWQVCPGIEETAKNSPDAHSFEVFVSPHTHHWTDSEEHRAVRAVSISRLLPNTRFCGFSLFTNSFGQPSAYAFTGKYWPSPFESAPGVYLSVSGGIMYGYVGRYKDKVPLNLGGFSPVVIPAVGFRLNSRSAIEVQLLGTAALMFGATWRY